MRQAGRRSNRQAKVEVLVEMLVREPDRASRRELLALFGEMRRSDPARDQSSC